MYRCIVCLEIINENICTNCNIEYSFEHEENTPFYNQLSTLIEIGEINLAKIAIENWIEEIEITLESSKIQIPLLTDIEYYINMINSKMINIKDILSKMIDQIENNEFVRQTMQELSIREKEISELLLNLRSLENKINNQEYLYSEIKKSGIDIDYLAEKIISYQE